MKTKAKPFTLCRACGEEVDHPVCTMCICKLVGATKQDRIELQECKRLLKLFAKDPLDPDPDLIKEMCNYARR